MIKYSNVITKSIEKKVVKAIRSILFLIVFFVPHFAWSMTEDLDVQASTNKIVEGILSFSRWPSVVEHPLLCISQQAKYFNMSKATGNGSYRVVTISDSTKFNSAGCNAIYLGQESVKQQSAIINSLEGQHVLTISENNSDCVAGASFCINRRNQRFKFSVNLDSLTRSGVRVNSDVLLLSRDGDE